MRRVITQNTLLLKYQKQAITAALNEGNALSNIKISILKIETITNSIRLFGSVYGEIKCHNHKSLHCWKKCTKAKNITILYFGKTFHNFDLRIETG